MESSELEGKILSSRVYPDFFPLCPHERIINIGCGEGPQAIVYSGHYGMMIGVDINLGRLQNSKEAMDIYGVKNYETVCSNVEKIPLPDRSFDKALAIDIIEHVKDPKSMCLEANRLLRDGGQLLITFPVMYDRYRDFVSWIGRRIFGHKKEDSSAWNPDAHNHRYSIKKWTALIESCGFAFSKSRATTLFPPLYLYGIPRFWYTSNVIYAMDGFFSKMKILKSVGQTMLCVFVKNDDPTP